jgi:membrane-associated HD superfamily phosphohydrolase
MKKQTANTLRKTMNTCILLGFISLMISLLFSLGTPTENQIQDLTGLFSFLLGLGVSLLIIGVIINYIIFNSKIN